MRPSGSPPAMSSWCTSVHSSMMVIEVGGGERVVLVGPLASLRRRAEHIREGLRHEARAVLPRAATLACPSAVNSPMPWTLQPVVAEIGMQSSSSRSNNSGVLRASSRCGKLTRMRLVSFFSLLSSGATRVEGRDSGLKFARPSVLSPTEGKPPWSRCVVMPIADAYVIAYTVPRFQLGSRFCLVHAPQLVERGQRIGSGGDAAVGADRDSIASSSGLPLPLVCAGPVKPCMMSTGCLGVTRSSCAIVGKPVAGTN